MTTGWEDEGKQQYFTVGYYKTKAEALAALAAYNENPIGERGNLTWGGLYDEWSSRAYQSMGRSMMNGYRAAWKRLAKLEKEPVRLIKTSHLQDVVEGMIDEGLSRSSLEKAKTLAGILMERAHNDDIIKTNYARAIKLPPLPQVEADHVLRHGNS